HEPQQFSFDFVLTFLRRHAWIILLASLVAGGLGLAYFLLVGAPYTAVATLTIDTRRFQLFQQPANLGEQLIDSSGAVESQLEVLRSENILLKVINDLKLADDPEFGYGHAIPLISAVVESRKTDSQGWRTRNALKTLDRSLKVKRIGIAYVIEISVDS